MPKNQTARQQQRSELMANDPILRLIFKMAIPIAVRVTREVRAARVQFEKESCIST